MQLPYSKARIVVISFAKPAIVQNKELNSRFLAFPCDVKDLVLVKVHLCGFPVVEKDWTRLILVGAADNVVIYKAVTVVAKVVKAILGVGQHNLRSFAAFALFKRP